MKKLLTLLLCAAMVFSMLAGCGTVQSGQPSEPTASSSQNEGSPTDTSTSQKNSEITMMVINSFTKNPDDALFKAAEKFTSQNPNIKVNIEGVPATNIKDKFVTAALAGAGPDIVSLDNAGWVPDAASMGLLAKIDDKFDPIKDQFIDGAVETGKYAGNYYSVPWYSNNTGLIYNKQMFQQANITKVPETWEELADAAAKLKAIGKSGVMVPLESLGGYVIGNFFMQNGNPIIDTSGSEPKVTICEPSGLEAFTFVTDLGMKHGTFPEGVKSALSWDQACAPFIQEDVGMMISGDWVVGTIQAGNQNIDVGIAPLPKGKYAATTLGGYVLCINSQTKDFESSWKFIEFLTAKEQNDVLLAYGRMGARKDIDKEALLKDKPYLEVFINQANDGKSRPVVPRWEEMQKSLGMAFAAVILGAKTPEEALKQCETEMNELLKN